MKKVFILVLFFNFILAYAQDKVVSKNGKEIEVNKDASTTSKGVVKLAGDLGGTADLPTVPGLTTKQDVLTLTTTGTGAATLTGSTLNIPTPSQGSPFTLQGTTTDAGTDKTSVIDRSGSIEVKSGYLKAIGNGNTFTIDPTDATGPRLKLGPVAVPNGYFELGSYNSINNFDTKTRDFNLMSTAKNNAFYLKNDTGFIGIGIGNPLSLFSNAASTTNFVSSNNSTQSTTGISWLTNTTGYNTSLYNSNNVVGSNGLQIKVANTSNQTIALEVGQNTTLSGTSIPLFNVLGNGNVGIGTNTPATKLEITSGISGTSGLRFTNLTSAATPSSNSNFLSLDASGNVIYATSGTTLPLITANGINSATTEVRDYNVWANRGNGFYITDSAGAIGNAIPNNGAWFALSQVANGSNYFGQTSLNDQGFWFRGGPTSTIVSNTWFRTLSLNANSRFVAQWDNTTNNTVTLNNRDNGPLAFATNDLERMRILANGNIGIGTTTPSAQLEVATNNALSTIIRRGGTADLTPANLVLQKTMGADAATHGAVTNGNFVGRILFSASNGTTYPTNGTDIVGYTAGLQSATNNGGGILFRTVPQNSIAPSIERMRIEHNGNVGIGTPNPTTNLDIVGGMSLRNVVGATGSNYGIEFNTNSNSPRIDWIYNGSYTGSFAGDSDFFFRLQNSKQGSGGFRFMTNPSGTALERLTILNNGNIGIGNTAPSQKMNIVGINNQPATTGTASNAILRIEGSTNHVLDFGTYANSPFGSYVQSVDKSNLATGLPLTLNPVAGNVGIGTSNPTSKLEVNGAATNTTAFNAAAGTSIDFSKSNLAYTTASAGAFTLTNLKDGGTYTLAVQGATSGTSSFTATGFTFKSPNNSATIASKHTLYTFIVMGTTVYYYMTTGL
ncbi:hypothetical protein RF683_02575 [Flavobacterium sp. 20NA77.7]|uniref:Uncharacterized protein n=1 Tax=Flavobacterium nakdongensis TaxID=3073563 RepID=A0ABY9RAS8_9FLAO|nr:hypothetical protein [Flavobacterium sp. 20NA77.7]WMW78347.1 hypothetical protein RF683_02575 [Flavobacterium sp. 20NA77.7]